MRFDVLSLVDHIPDPHTGKFNETQAGRYEQLLDMAVTAEQGDMGGIWLGEHHTSHCIMPSPQMVLAAAAVRTKRIRLGTAVSLLPNTDPVRMAEEFATLDLLSHGRAELGLGSGITEHTFKLFGQRLEDISSISVENLELLEKLWTDDEVTWSGKHRPPIDHLRIEPRTYSGKPIPIMRAAGSSIEKARDAGLRGHQIALGNAILGSYTDSREAVAAYRQAYRESGHDPQGMCVAASAYVYLQSDGQKAREYWQPYRNNNFHYGEIMLRKLGARMASAKRFEASGMKMENLRSVKRQSEMIGEPSEIIDMIHQANEQVGGADVLMILFDVGGMSRVDTAKSLDLFIEKVVPAFPAHFYHEQNVVADASRFQRQ